MRAWPKAFEYDPLFRSEFVSACEAMEIYGIPREEWKSNLPVWDANFVWNEAKRLLNI